MGITHLQRVFISAAIVLLFSPALAKTPTSSSPTWAPCWKTRSNCSNSFSGKFLTAKLHPSLVNQLQEKWLKSIRALRSKSFHTNICDIFQRGRPGQLAKAHVFIPDRQTDEAAKQKFLFSNTSGGRPLSSSSSSHSFFLLYLSHNPLIKVQIKKDCAHLSGRPSLLEVRTSFIIYY